MRNIVKIKKVKVDLIKPLRYQVLWPHLENEAACQIEPDNENSTFHIAALLEDKIVGTATLIVDVNKKFSEPNQYRLRAMATAPEVRGYGVGAKIIQNVIAELKKREVKLVWCDARLIATGFYEKQDFRVKGKAYQVPDIGPHKLMYKEL